MRLGSYKVNHQSSYTLQLHQMGQITPLHAPNLAFKCLELLALCEMFI